MFSWGWYSSKEDRPVIDEDDDDEEEEEVMASYPNVPHRRTSSSPQLSWRSNSNSNINSNHHNYNNNYNNNNNNNNDEWDKDISQERLRNQFESILERAKTDRTELIDDWLKELRLLVLNQGLPEETQIEKKLIQEDRGCTLRGKIWKVFLRVKHVNAEYYIELLKNGPTTQYVKCARDIARTWNYDRSPFRERVPGAQLRRVLNSFVLASGGMQGSRFHYLQGMNYMCGMFAYCMTEVDTYFAFSRFATMMVPTYINEGRDMHLPGAYAGCQLADYIIEIIDPQVSQVMQNASLQGKAIFFKSMLSFFSESARLTDEFHKLWDFYFAFGFHMNILCVVSQVLKYRDDILNNPTAVQSLFNYKSPTLSQFTARDLFIKAMKLVPLVPSDVYEYLVAHLYDLSACEAINKKTWIPQVLVERRQDEKNREL